MKEPKELRKGNVRSVLRNVIYLLPGKLTLLLLIGILAFGASVQVFEVCRLYTDDRDGVRNVFVQGGHFELLTSEPFHTEMEQLVDNVLRYALVYQDLENFAGADVLQSQIRDHEKSRDSQIETVGSICTWQAEAGTPAKEYLKKGFIRQNADGSYTADTTAIRAHYEAVYADLIESEKTVMDSNYRDITLYLEECPSVRYAVADNTRGRIVTNTDCETKAALAAFFAATQNNLLVYNSDAPVYPATELQDFVPLVEEKAQNYTQNFDFYLSLGDDLAFNDACRDMAARARTLYHAVYRRAVTSIILLAFMLVLSVLLLLVAGRREYKGAIKYCATDHLPNEVHLFFHLVIAASMLVLIQSSFHSVLLTKIDEYWFPTFPEYYARRGEFCFVALVLTVLAALCTFKRHYKNKSLLSNTMLAILLRRLGVLPRDKKKQTQEEDSH